MSVEKMSTEECQEYMSSASSTIDIWKSCYFAMLSNPEYKDTEMRDLVTLSRTYALALKTEMREHLGLKVERFPSV
jgi:transketolase N-terminal domain/subunit